MDTETVAAVNCSNVTSIYTGTLHSIVGRITPSGWMPTSVASATYSGMFVRDSAAGIFALLEIDEYSLAKNVLFFMLTNMEKAALPHAPHVLLGGPGGVTSWDMTDQPDGAFHLIIAWALYVNVTKDHPMQDRFYPLMARFLDYYVAPGAVFPNTSIPYINATLKVWSSALTRLKYGDSVSVPLLTRPVVMESKFGA